ncbi:MAG: peptide chain release factor N(5)-glutamine methyltransferase [Planctomycetes bacterium]|nr:peptide chain release factor N(5)-glutamine methyltransferase [Planctomycetota bacterium]
MTAGPVHTVLSVLRGAESWLAARGIDAPKRSAELLLGHVLGLGRLQLYLQHDRPMAQAERDALRSLVARRGQGEPVAHLLGSWSFRGHELAVSSAVLIPRPETESLVSLVLERAGQGARVLDLGTGSGAIAIALAVERPDLRVTAVEVSRNAVAVAGANAARHGVAERLDLRLGSWWEPIAAAEQFEIVVSNPPYIDPGAPDGLEPEVARFEPPLALYTARGDVVSCYRAIAAGLAQHLAVGGWFCAETGQGAAQPALALLQSEPALAEVTLANDEQGLGRYLLARRA